MKTSKRITHLSLGGLEIPMDARRDWQDFLKAPTNEKTERAGGELHFLIHLGWIDLPDTIKRRFWEHYDKPARKKARSVAIHSLVACNYENEWLLAFSAMEFHKKRTSGGFKKDHEAANAHAISIAVSFSEMVGNLDVGAFRRLLKIMEHRGLPPGERGGIGSEDGYMLEKFAELHARTYSLPNKKQLREACGLNGDPIQKKLADKRMKKLGLWGLPTEPEK